MESATFILPVAMGATMNFRAMTLMGAAFVAVAGCDYVPGTPQARARSALSGYLYDPAAAKISVLHASPSALCGTVNGKNRLGGYVGAQPFLLTDGDRPVVFDGTPSVSDYRVWSSAPKSPDGQEAYAKMEDGCAFKSLWSKSCGASSAETIILDEEFCAAWRAKDWEKLSFLDRY
jgi:hypothetical protein